MIIRPSRDPTCCVTPDADDDNHAMLLYSGVIAGLAISGKSRREGGADLLSAD